MKALSLIALLQLAIASPLWSQTPTPKLDPEYVVVVGDVSHPGVVPYTAGMKLMDAIHAIGDSGFADRLSIDLIRCGKKERIKLRHGNFIQPEPVLQPWDIVYLPGSFF